MPSPSSQHCIFNCHYLLQISIVPPVKSLTSLLNTLCCLITKTYSQSCPYDDTCFCIPCIRCYFLLAESQPGKKSWPLLIIIAKRSSQDCFIYRDLLWASFWGQSLILTFTNSDCITVSTNNIFCRASGG